MAKKEKSGHKIHNIKEPPPEKPDDKGFKTRTVEKGDISDTVQKDLSNQDRKK